MFRENLLRYRQMGIYTSHPARARGIAREESREKGGGEDGEPKFIFSVWPRGRTRRRVTLSPVMTVIVFILLYRTARPLYM